MSREEHGRQLELALDDELVVVPWGGGSPRELTAAYERFILQPRAEKSVSDCDQLDMFDLRLPAKKGPSVYRGAPLLVPFVTPAGRR